MCAPPEWLPNLILLADHNDDWSQYVEAVYAEFHHDFVQTQPKFQEKWVRCRRDPIVDGKEAGFWHCISTGKDETTRTPEIRRMERIRWVRSLIEHAGTPPVDCWSNLRRNERRWCLWYAGEFLVILAERERERDGFRYLQLITAYDTREEHRQGKLKRERDEWLAKNG